MKKEIFLRSIALLVAIVLTTTFTFGNYSFVSAEETSTGTDDDKELVQCSDDWVIFKYEDENGEPQFDVKYNEKSAEELENEGLQLQYRIIINDTRLYLGRWRSIKEDTDLGFSEDKCKIQYRILNDTDNTITSISDSIPLERTNDSLVHVLYSNSDYYYNLCNKPNSFNLKIKLNEPLKQTGDLSVKIATDYSMAEDYLLNHKISNISFENYNNSYNLNGRKYVIDYSIIRTV